MKLIKRNNYPPYILDTVDRTVLEDDNGNPIMVSHFFNQQELGCHAKKWRKNDIHFGNAPLRGMLPLHMLYYRSNEAKIPSMTRMGFQ